MPTPIPIRVVIADDEVLVRGGLCMLMTMAPDIEVVADVGDGQQALRAIAQLRPDVAILDVRMPGLDGVETTRRINRGEYGAAGVDHDEVSVLVMSTFNLDSAVFAALRAGASGFLLKDAAPTDLLPATRAVANGDAWIDPAVARSLIAEFTARPDNSLPPPEDLRLLTPREREVLILMADGLNNAEIAKALLLGEGTVKTHVSRILIKLGLRDRTQAVVLAFRSHLV
jgi:DNA-binding NarL/FixJ family response regulator